MSTIQKRKNPLTTIAISQEYASKIDQYIKDFNMTRKDFVELAINYFQRTGFDIRSEAFDLSPLEKITLRLEESLTSLNTKNDELFVFKNLLESIKEQSLKQISSVLEKEKTSVILSEKDIEIKNLKQENELLKQYKDKAIKELLRVKYEQKTFGKIDVDTDL